MKIVHTADLHIGKVVNEYSMLEDQGYILSQIIQIIEEEKADVLLIGGDVYDRSIPPAEAVTLLDGFLKQLVTKKITVCMISGNHDSPERLSFADDILKQSGVYIAGTFTKDVKSVTLTDGYGTVQVYLLPFAKPQVMRHYLKEEHSTERDNNVSYEQCVREIVEQIPMIKENRSILVTHHFVTNMGISPETSDSEIQLSVGDAGNVDASVFEGFDYVALGHIHRGQKVKEDNIRYSGSPLKYSFSEVHHKKAVTIIDLKEKGNIRISERELTPLHDMRSIKGKLKDLMKEEIVQAANPEDYLQVTLTDTDELIDPIGVLRAVYPNIMQLVIEKNVRVEKDIAQAEWDIKSRSTLDIYQEFYETVTGRTFDEKREQVIQTLLEQMEGGTSE